MPSIYLLETHYPAKADKSGLDTSVAYANPKVALENAKKKAKEGRSNVVIQNMGDDAVGVFVDVAGDLALIMQYKVRAVELVKS